MSNAIAEAAALAARKATAGVAWVLVGVYYGGRTTTVEP